MKNSNEFSAVEKAAMEQSPTNETDIRHNFAANSDFIDKITPEVKVVNIEPGALHTPQVKMDTNITPAVAVDANDAVTQQAVGGSVADGVFSQKHVTLLKNIDQECSVDELVDLRNSLNRANKTLKNS